MGMTELERAELERADEENWRRLAGAKKKLGEYLTTTRAYDRQLGHIWDIERRIRRLTEVRMRVT